MIYKVINAAVAGKAIRACVWVCFGVVAGGLWQQAMAATHSIPISTSSVDCGSFGGGIRAGDVLVLKGRSRGKIQFENCKGTVGNPIKIQNDTAESGPLIIESSGSGFQSMCTNCEHVTWDGTGKWAGAPGGTCGVSMTDGYRVLGSSQCGIVFRCLSGGPHSSLRFNGSSRNFTVKGVEIDGNYPSCSSGIGLSINDHEYELADHPGEWREGIRLLNNYIHDSGSTAVYFGGNVNPDKGGAGDLPLRNNEIAFNYVDRPGCDGIKYKYVIDGLSRIHHNYVTNTGQSDGNPADGCTSAGIMLFEGGYTDIYSNYVESPSPRSSGAGTCITQNSVYLPAAQVGKLPTRIYNNVVHNCKGAGISSGRKDAASAVPVPVIYNNTVVAPVGGTGISVGASIATCEVRDNIVAGDSVGAGQCSKARNSLDAVNTQKFRAPEANDFRLTASSPAVDAGGTSCPSDDIWGVTRPSQGSCDIGAFEFSDGSELVKPEPPQSLEVK